MKRSNITLSDIARWRKQGRGCGEGANYKPWLRVRDVPSKGRSSRIRGLKTHRIHHLLSDLERNHFLHLDFNPNVTDIREQFPLFPLDEPMAIARELGIRYPCYPGTTTPCVLTTDFLVIYRDQHGSLQTSARTIKYSRDLADKRVLEKLEIERVFWQIRGVPWKIGMEDLNQKLVANLNWLRPQLDLVLSSQSADKLPEFLQFFRKRLNYQETLKELIQCASADANLRYQEGMLFFRFLAWHRIIEIDLGATILNLRSPLPSVSIKDMENSPAIVERRVA